MREEIDSCLTSGKGSVIRHSSGSLWPAK